MAGRMLRGIHIIFWRQAQGRGYRARVLSLVPTNQLSLGATDLLRRITSKWSRRAQRLVSSCRQGARLIWRVSQLGKSNEAFPEMKRKTVPTFDELMNPTLQALKRLGGSASIDELVQRLCGSSNCRRTWRTCPMAPRVGPTGVPLGLGSDLSSQGRPDRELRARHLGPYSVGLSDRIRRWSSDRP